MKKLLLLSAVLFTLFVSAQVPQGISYQAIALNGSGNAVVNSNVGLRLSILDNAATGSVLYSETHVKTTNAQGLFNLVIGQGTPSSGSFAGINWSVNSKFLKVEMDASGGTNYVLVGTTQLLSVPYALASDSLITSPGEGITLLSPNGTPYQVAVNDSGQLSLPTSNIAATLPGILYMYGSFNAYNPSTALLMGVSSANGEPGVTAYFSAYKYITAGTEVKFLAQNNAASPVYGLNFLNIVLNGSAFTFPNNGFYNIAIARTFSDVLNFDADSIQPQISFSASTSNYPMTYNAATNTFSAVINNVIQNNFFRIYIPTPGNGSSSYGDNLSDGTIEYSGSNISFPNASATPKNYRIDLIINFNGSGNYTITQI